MTNFCKLDFCRQPATVLTDGSNDIGMWCAEHAAAYESSHEAQRHFYARLRSEPQASHVFVAALSDFRTRMELEHQRDADPVVLAARGGVR